MIRKAFGLRVNCDSVGCEEYAHVEIPAHNPHWKTMFKKTIINRGWRYGNKKTWFCPECVKKLSEEVKA